MSDLRSRSPSKLVLLLSFHSGCFCSPPVAFVSLYSGYCRFTPVAFISLRLLSFHSGCFRFTPVAFVSLRLLSFHSGCFRFTPVAFVSPLGWGGYNAHPRMLPRIVKGDQEGSHGIPCSVRQFFKTAYVISPTRSHTGSVVFRINFRISGC
jgi:hypothetical protein